MTRTRRNVTARRDLATIWLEKHRAARALPLLEQAIARDGKSLELLYLTASRTCWRGNPDRPSTRWSPSPTPSRTSSYGEAYLRAADALMALSRWDDADDALEHYLKINSSSVEAR